MNLSKKLMGNIFIYPSVFYLNTKEYKISATIQQQYSNNVANVYGGTRNSCTAVPNVYGGTRNSCADKQF
jgi:hypothetical protein